MSERNHEKRNTLIYITLFIIANIIGQAYGQSCSDASCTSCPVDENTCEACNIDWRMGLDTSGACVDCQPACARCGIPVTTCQECSQSGTGPNNNPADGDCSACADNCVDCFMAGPGKCEPDGCSPKFAFDSTSETCLPCAGENCPGCVVPNTCPTCVDGTGLDGSGTLPQEGCKKCTVLHAAQCTADYKTMVTCMDGYFANYTLNTCEPICAAVTREEWMAAPPKGSIAQLAHRVPLIIIHHTKSAFCFTYNACLSIIKGMQKQHQSTTPTETNAWGLKDIAYNYLIGEDGSIYEGVGKNYCGNHTKGSYTFPTTMAKVKYNTVSYGIAFIGDFVTRSPNTKALNALRRFLSTKETNMYSSEYGCIDDAYAGIDPMYKIYNHWDLECTKCPGGQLRAAIKREFSAHYKSTTINCPERNWKHPMKK